MKIKVRKISPTGKALKYKGQWSLPMKEKFVPIQGLLNLNLYQSHTIGMKCTTIVTLVNMRTRTQWEVTHWLETVKLRQISQRRQNIKS